jgi:hypothetical protein
MQMFMISRDECQLENFGVVSEPRAVATGSNFNIEVYARDSYKLISSSDRYPDASAL